MEPTLSSTVKRLTIESAKYRAGTLAALTRSGYAYDWALFRAWCKRMRREPLPASAKTLALHLTDLLDQGKKVSTAERRAWSVAHHHKAKGLRSPFAGDCKAILSGAKRIRCEQPRQMKPIGIKQLTEAAGILSTEATPVAIRNRAILVVGFFSALRRSSLSALNLADIEFSEKGCTLHVRKEKQDQEGRGRWIGLPPAKDQAICPVGCLQDWLKLRGRGKGPLFTRLDTGAKGLQPLSDTCMWLLVKKAVKKTGIDASEYSPHSLRSGFITEAGQQNVSMLIIASQTGHRSMNTLKRYFRRTDVFKSNACSLLGS